MNETQTPMVRPFWDERQYHRDVLALKSVTAVICERDTADVTKLCIESLLRFYPDLPILIVDGGSKDDSINYVRYKALTTPNIRLWEREGRNGHGTMLDEAIRNYITTDYVLLLDSDIIVKRGGWIESMVDYLNSSHDYAIGTLMLVTNSNEGCGEPKDENDVLRYAHPSCSIVRREQYLKMRPFVEHGAPLVYNMQDAKQLGLKISYFPIDLFVAHLSGASWTNPQTVWRDDLNVMVRPFITFITYRGVDLSFLVDQHNKDFDVVFAGQWREFNIAFHNRDLSPEIHAKSSNLYALRFRVQGEYVCVLKDQNYYLSSNFISTVKQDIISNRCPQEYETSNLRFVKRQLWQNRDSIL